MWRASLTSWRWRMRTDLLCCSCQMLRWPTWLVSVTAIPTSSCRTRWLRRKTSRGSLGCCLYKINWSQISLESNVCFFFSGSAVLVQVQLEREEEVTGPVIAPLFPQVIARHPPASVPHVSCPLMFDCCRSRTARRAGGW